MCGRSPQEHHSSHKVHYLVGGVIGYLVKEYVIERNSTYIPMHPEMFDENGQIIPDEVLAGSCENSLEDFQDEDSP